MDKTPAQLIRDAFEQSRRSGKPDWHRMTIAVLKNRLLTLTNREFNESNYGAHTMREFVDLARDEVSIDSTAYPPTVILLNAEREKEAERPPTKARVRSDLWRATLDYTNGSGFVWDADIQKARAASPADSLPVIPTITEDEMRGWRVSFAERNALLALDEKTRRQLQEWSERILSSKVLPRSLASAWLTELAAIVVERLRSWFAANSIDEPPDLLQHSPQSRSHPTSGKLDSAELRHMVIACIEVMSEYELSELRFSPAVLLRAEHRRKRRAN